MRKVGFFLLIAVVMGIGVLHFVTPGYMMIYHDTYRRLSYFPIVLGALLYGWKGGVTLGILASIAFIPHLLLYIGQSIDLYLSEVMEVFLYLAAGTVTGVIASRQKRLQEKYKKLAEKLEESYQRLHEETELLLEAEEQLSASQRLSALGKLSASLAHEIKNPLGSIKGIAEIFLDEFPDGHPKREFADILIKETGRLDSTVQEVLRYSRGQKKQDETALEPVSVSFQRVVKLVETHLRKKSVRFQAVTVPEADEYLVNSDKMMQVFMNVILNAIEAIDENGEVSVRFSVEEKGLHIVIADDGPGIDPAHLANVFTPFVSGKEGGTGLGLSISKKIVESYGGTLTCRNRDEGGVAFNIFLPKTIESGQQFELDAAQ